MKKLYCITVFLKKREVEMSKSTSKVANCSKPLWPGRLVPWQCMRDFILRMHAVTLGTQRWVLVCYGCYNACTGYRVPLWCLRRDHFRRPGSFD